MLVALLTELASCLSTHWRSLAPWLLLLACLHLGFEWALPALRPSVYDIFNAGGVSSGKAPRSRGALARDVRTRAVASLFSLYVVGAALWGWLSGDASALAGAPLTASTPLTEHLVRCACAFFLWDTYVSLADDYGAAYVFHGVACSLVFALALRPVMHSMVLVVLGFEASTPLLHARLLMIAAGRARGPLFSAVVWGFAASFFTARIAIGWGASLPWARQVAAELATPSPGGPLPAVCMAYLALNVSLNALNGWWMWEIAKVAVGGGKAQKQKQRGEPGARDKGA